VSFQQKVARSLGDGGICNVSYISPAKAASRDACAIWLCLPGGFPQGCGGAYTEFKHRIKKGRPPLPDLSSCTIESDGEKFNGRYQLGFEEYYPCEDGFELKIKYESEGDNWARCVSKNYLSCSYREGAQIIRRDENLCYYYYTAKSRPKPNYVKMWVDGQYLGQFYW